MPKLTTATPKYQKHRASGQAVVSIGGRDHYLGPHGSKTSIAEYDRLIAEWLQNGRRMRSEATSDLTVDEVIDQFWQDAQRKYGEKEHAYKIKRTLIRCAAREREQRQIDAVFVEIGGRIRVIDANDLEHIGGTDCPK